MNERNVYHRLGEPGGAGCPLSTLDVTYNNVDGKNVSADLCSAGKNASELEMLRTVAHKLGVKWGEDDLGWWAVVSK